MALICRLFLFSTGKTSSLINYNKVDCRGCLRSEFQCTLSSFLNLFITAAGNQNARAINTKNDSFHPHTTVEYMLHQPAASWITIKPDNLHHFYALMATFNDVSFLHSFMPKQGPASVHLQSQCMQPRTSMYQNIQTMDFKVEISKRFDGQPLETNELYRIRKLMEHRADDHGEGSQLTSIAGDVVKC
ncbi:unnamed protein product [Linum tenue]|uniref:Uncharacterized protein n=1 Tax=Linum tenue TaxID=586396 RepID=A0AAV0IFX8_9ROSI|nr:unnamed protein product [Linum tenue]